MSGQNSRDGDARRGPPSVRDISTAQTPGMDDADVRSDELNPLVAQIMQEQAERWAHVPPRWSLPMPEARQQTLELSQRWNQSLCEMAAISELTIIGNTGVKNRARLFVPEDADGALILYFHGGGWVVGDIGTHEGVARQLASDCGSAVLSCNYRLAPEDPFPAGLDDCIDVWRQLLSGTLHLDYTLSGPVALAGDSAGANLALGVMLHELAHKRALPDYGIFFYGVYGYDLENASYQAFADGPGLTRADMQAFWNWYAPLPANKANPFAVPLLSNDEALSQCPPLFIGAASVDPLLQENKLLIERLHKLDRTDIWREYPGMPHGFLQMCAEVPLARAALQEAGDAFKAFKSCQS